MTHDCACRSGERTLALVPGSVRDRNRDFEQAIREYGWRDRTDLGLVLVSIGPSRQFQSARQVCDVLRAMLSAEEFGFVRAAWLEADRPVDQQMASLLKAPALAEFMSVEGSSLLRILDSDALETWFQPVLDADGRDLFGFECLMRGRDPDGDLVSPGSMIELARQAQLTFMLDRVSRETHIRNAARLNPPSDARFLINFLPNAIYEPKFCLQTTMAALETTPLEPGQIMFEVVETEAIADQDHLKAILEHYRHENVGVALDDLGSGFSGLEWLGELNPDLIKIERAIVNRAPESDMHAEIAQSLIELGQSRNIRVLAEGVETEAEHRMMRDLGVDLVQGFYFGRPTPTPDVPWSTAGE